MLLSIIELIVFDFCEQKLMKMRENNAGPRAVEGSDGSGKLGDHESAAPSCKHVWVVRYQMLQRKEPEDLVVGDVFLVQPDMFIPADSVLIQTFFVNGGQNNLDHHEKYIEIDYQEDNCNRDGFFSASTTTTYDYIQEVKLKSLKIETWKDIDVNFDEDFRMRINTQYESRQDCSQKSVFCNEKLVTGFNKN